MRQFLFGFFLLIFGTGPAFSLSGEIHVHQYIEAEAGTLLGISREEGFVVSRNNGRTWTAKNDGIPRQVAYPFDSRNPIPLTSISADPTDSDRIAVTSYWGLYITENGGSTWQEIPLKDPIRRSAYITSAAISPYDSSTFIVGTSFSGVYITRDSGETWNEYEFISEPLSRGAGFLEEITSVIFHPLQKDEIYLAVGFGTGIYHADLQIQTISRIPFPGDEGNAYIRQLTAAAAESLSDQFALTVHTSAGSWKYNAQSEKWFPTSAQKRFTPSLTAKKRQRLNRASDKYGIYLKSWNASGEDLQQFITFLQEHGMNSFVVDVKDDLGRVTYNTALEEPKKAGAVRKHINMKELLKTAHEHGMYVIGRIVTFQDPKLYRYQNYQYAVWNYQEEGPWGHKFKVEDEETEEVSWVQREFWVDPFSEFAWEYNISIAEELEDLGIDEIQFDYIRFPSDGDMTGIHYRYRKEGMRKIDAIESFLRIVRERISIPVSTDLYGFNSWYRMGNWIGQNLEMVSHYVDAISPMYYPSHFPRDFLKTLTYFKRARHIYREGTLRSSYITEGRSIIRPYVQAFLLGGELNFEEPEYTDYLIQQIEGAQEGFASGFTLWNNSNRYYMVTKSLKPYTADESNGHADIEENTALMD